MSTKIEIQVGKEVVVFELHEGGDGMWHLYDNTHVVVMVISNTLNSKVLTVLDENERIRYFQVQLVEAIYNLVVRQPQIAELRRLFVEKDEAIRRGVSPYADDGFAGISGVLNPYISVPYRIVMLHGAIRIETPRHVVLMEDAIKHLEKGNNITFNDVSNNFLLDAIEEIKNIGKL